MIVSIGLIYRIKQSERCIQRHNTSQYEHSAWQRIWMPLQYSVILYKGTDTQWAEREQCSTYSRAFKRFCWYWRKKEILWNQSTRNWNLNMMTVAPRKKFECHYSTASFSTKKRTLSGQSDNDIRSTLEHSRISADTDALKRNFEIRARGIYDSIRWKQRLGKLRMPLQYSVILYRRTDTQWAEITKYSWPFKRLSWYQCKRYYEIRAREIEDSIQRTQRLAKNLNAITGQRYSLLTDRHPVGGNNEVLSSIQEAQLILTQEIIWDQSTRNWNWNMMNVAPGKKFEYHYSTVLLSTGGETPSGQSDNNVRRTLEHSSGSVDTGARKGSSEIRARGIEDSIQWT
jgi:hypothetical protein